MERINTYEKWLEQEGLPVIRDYSVPDLMEVELKPWARKGGLGAYINLIGAQGHSDAYLCEIPPGKHLIPQKHLYEELIYILSGNGATTVWVEGDKKQTFEWQEGSLFSPPMNFRHQHFNRRIDTPVKYLGITRAPFFMNLFHDLDFVFGCDYVFTKRYSGQDDYFNLRGKPFDPDDKSAGPKIWEKNLILDCRTVELLQNPKRGGLGSSTFFELSDGMMSAHVSEFPGGAYLKAHYHGPGAPHLFLSGQGYILMWPADNGIMAQGVERIKINCRKNTLYSAPERWFEQRFSTGKESARYLAFHHGHSRKYDGIGKRLVGNESVKHGGTQIDYEDEDPEIRRLFKEKLAKTGASWKMAEYFPGE